MPIPPDHYTLLTNIVTGHKTEGLRMREKGLRNCAFQAKIAISPSLLAPLDERFGWSRNERAKRRPSLYT